MDATNPTDKHNDRILTRRVERAIRRAIRDRAEIAHRRADLGQRGQSRLPAPDPEIARLRRLVAGHAARRARSKTATPAVAAHSRRIARKLRRKLRRAVAVDQVRRARAQEVVNRREARADRKRVARAARTVLVDVTVILLKDQPAGARAAAPPAEFSARAIAEYARAAGVDRMPDIVCERGVECAEADRARGRK